MNALLQFLNSDNYRTYNLYVAKKLHSVNASIMLCELIQRYAYHQESNNLIKLRAHEGLWFYLTQEKCEERTALSRKEQDTAIKKLEEYGLIKKIISGVPCTRHFQINEAKIFEFFNLIEYKKPSTDINEPVAPKGQTGLSERGKLVCPKGANWFDRKGQTTKETKEELLIKKTTTTKRQNSSSLLIDRNLEQLNALKLEAAQKHTLYSAFDDQTILDAIVYYQSLKKKPHNLGAFLYTACQKKWKKSTGKEESISLNKKLTLQVIGHWDNLTLKGMHIGIFQKGITFSGGSSSHNLDYEDVDFKNKLSIWIDKLESNLKTIHLL